jgi:endoglucanase
MRISHYRASWVSASKNWSEPTWPLVLGPDNVWNKQRLQEDIIEPWVQLEQQGTFVHVGEWGCYNKTPHHVALSWMEDFLQLWDELKWGWALWNLRGSFGVLDSGREDVNYEDFNGHKLDRKMLELIRRY